MADSSPAVTVDDIREAHERIRSHIHRTPVIHSRQLDANSGSQVFFKCENLQKGGAFKARGALNAVLGLPETALAAGVATHSSGNHGAALAMAAAVRAMPATIVMPSNSSAVKKAAVAGYGGRVVECEPTLAAREKTLARVVAESGAHVVHPYDDPRIIAGQGTAALELLEQLDQLDAVVIPVGGGGLLAGVALAVKALHPRVEVIAAEPAGADDAFRSFGLGRRVLQENPNTIADGLLTSLGELNYAIIREQVDTIVTVEEENIVRAMQLQWTRLKSVVEPSGAVSFAAVLEHPERFRGRRVACIISGGNVDLSKLPW
jgi:threonine dehydratase